MSVADVVVPSLDVSNSTQLPPLDPVARGVRHYVRFSASRPLEAPETCN